MNAFVNAQYLHLKHSNTTTIYETDYGKSIDCMEKRCRLNWRKSVMMYEQWSDAKEI